MKTPEEIANHLLRHWRLINEYWSADGGAMPVLYKHELEAMRTQFVKDLREILVEPKENKP